LELRSDDDEENDPGENQNGRFYLEFWSEFLNGLELDSADQPRPRTRRKGNQPFHLPTGGGTNIWVTVFRSQSDNVVGVFGGVRRGTVGVTIQQQLRTDRDDIDRELGLDVDWGDRDARYFPISRVPTGDLGDLDHRARVISWLRDTLNRYVNVFRPRVQKIASELGI